MHFRNFCWRLPKVRVDLNLPLIFCRTRSISFWWSIPSHFHPTWSTMWWQHLLMNSAGHSSSDVLIFLVRLKKKYSSTTTSTTTSAAPLEVTLRLALKLAVKFNCKSFRNFQKVLSCCIAWEVFLGSSTYFCQTKSPALFFKFFNLSNSFFSSVETVVYWRILLILYWLCAFLGNLQNLNY